MYSQKNEEQFILDYFGTVGRNCVILDVGANDGVTFSNSRKMIELGAKAHLIEPSPTAFKRLYQLYRFNENVKLYHFGLLHKDTTAILYESGKISRLTPDQTDNIGMVSTYSKIHMEKFLTMVDFIQKQTELRTFETFMLMSNEYNFDLISIDVEGFELQVLSQIDLKKYNTKMLIIDWNNSESDKKNIIEYCSKYGLVLIHENPINLIFRK